MATMVKPTLTAIFEHVGPLVPRDAPAQGPVVVGRIDSPRGVASAEFDRFLYLASIESICIENLLPVKEGDVVKNQRGQLSLYSNFSGPHSPLASLEYDTRKGSMVTLTYGPVCNSRVFEVMHPGRDLQCELRPVFWRPINDDYKLLQEKILRNIRLRIIVNLYKANHPVTGAAVNLH